MVLPPSRAAPGLEILDDRADHADPVDAAVLVEPLILDRDHRLDQVRRHLLERHLDPLFLEDREDRLVGGVEDRRRLRHVAEAAQRGAVGQPGGQIVAEPCHPAGSEENDDREGRDGSRQDARTARRMLYG